MQMTALLCVQRTVEQQLGKADDGIHRRANLMAHIGQEAAARRGRLFGPVTGIAQLLLHQPSRGHVSSQLEYLAGLAVGVQDWIVGRLQPYLSAVTGVAAELARAKLTLAQGLPERRILRAGTLLGRTEHAMRQTAQGFTLIAKQIDKVVIDRENPPPHVELNQQHRLADGRYLAGILGIAQLGFRLVEQYTIDPARLSGFIAYRATTFPDPVFTALAVEQAVLHDVLTPFANGCRHLLGDRLQVSRVIEIGNRTSPLNEVTGRPTR